ncbi:hypothetical protein LZ554_006484 [Drepanopeziza brunnea f. sp. 'monogermtubi']|nr:hypothetical protein LZ554_006484 [Drepanopeziza brunnea f. sp. 'monogermtubi']
MASSSSQRLVHQDYIARIRYSNTLPPPPNPPKLLDIPNTGLASGQYTTPGFASRLARDQPLNIEADAELGMPLDLVGMPGIFDGDESSIQAPLHPPTPHPRDRHLLCALSNLGKPKFTDSGVSFLRRTEYISNASKPNRFESTTSRSLIDKTGYKIKRAAVNADRESPEAIKKAAEQSFTIASNLLKNPREVRHPSGKSNVKLLASYPLLPDLETIPDAGGYATVKFMSNPVPPGNTYDTRLDTSILEPIAPSEMVQIARAQAKEDYERDPENFPPPDTSLNYNFYMPEAASDAIMFKRKFDSLDPEKDSDDLYTQRSTEGRPMFRFKHVRLYESSQVSGDMTTKYDEEVVIAIHDGTDGLHDKAAYYYPIVQKISIKPQRNKNIQSRKMQYTPGASKEEPEGHVDYLGLFIEDPDEETRRIRDQYKTMPYGPDEEAPAATQ